MAETTLTGVATDPEGHPLTYLWAMVSGPNTPIIVSPTALSTRVTGLIQGTYIFRLSVSDGVNPPVTDDVKVTVPVSNQRKFEAIEARLPVSTSVTDRLAKQDALLETLGNQGYGQCYSTTNATRWYLLKEVGSTTKYEWKRWPWVNDVAKRLALTKQIGAEGYSNPFVWEGQVRASRPK